MKPVVDAVRKQLQVRTGNIPMINEDYQNVLFIQQAKLIVASGRKNPY